MTTQQPLPRESYHAYVARVGGMVTCGDHLGVMVGPEGSRVPMGWVFLPLGEKTTGEMVREAIEFARLGRKAWPAKA